MSKLTNKSTHSRRNRNSKLSQSCDVSKENTHYLDISQRKIEGKVF